MTSSEASAAPRKRRQHSESFKAQVVAECARGASMSSAALAHDVNVSSVRAWVRRAQAGAALPAKPGFVPIVASMTALADRAQPGQAIEVTLRRGEVRIDMRWPAGQAGVCTAWLGGFLR